MIKIRKLDVYWLAERFLHFTFAINSGFMIMPGFDKTLIDRLENESKRFKKEIEQKQQENVLLHEKISCIRSQIDESQKTYDDIVKVSQYRGTFERRPIS